MLWVKSLKNRSSKAIYDQIAQDRGGRFRLGLAIEYSIRWAMDKVRVRGFRGVMKSIRDR
jgi:hypothetical protein